MDDNRITSTDFDYDAYTGGSSYSDSNITSSDFDYDVYSGKSAMEYLRQENERRREALRQAKKSVAELKREEYENKFAGMSADELFGMPKKKRTMRTISRISSMRMRSNASESIRNAWNRN